MEPNLNEAAVVSVHMQEWRRLKPWPHCQRPELLAKFGLRWVGGTEMYYVVTFDDCGLESPLKAQSAISALALAQEANRKGCPNVVVMLPNGDVVPLTEFAAMHASGRLCP